jgi:hypothetical protein
MWNMTSCQSDENGSGDSQPVIEAATVSGGNITYGRSFTLSLKANGLKSCQANVNVKIGSKTLADKTFAIAGESFDGTTETIPAALFGELGENADLSVTVRLVNNDGGTTSSALSGVKGIHPVFNKLYFVPQTGSPIELNPQASGSNVFESGSVALGSVLSYKIAEKITGSSIDYSGIVVGFKDGEIQSIDVSGNFITETASGEVSGLSFDAFALTLTPTTAATRKLPVYMKARGWVIDYFGDMYGDDMIDLHFEYDAQNRLTAIWYDNTKGNGVRFEYDKEISGHTFVMVEYPYEDGVQIDDGVAGRYLGYEWSTNQTKRLYVRRSDNFNDNNHGYLLFSGAGGGTLQENSDGEKYTFDGNGNLITQVDEGDKFEWEYTNDKGIFSECTTPDWWFIWSWQLHFFLHNNKTAQRNIWSDGSPTEEENYVYTRDNAGYPITVKMTWEGQQPEDDDSYIDDIQYKNL